MPDTATPELTEEEVAVLEQDDPELLSELEKRRKRVREALYPKPDETDIQEFYRRMKALWGGHKAQMAVQRAVRYMEDRTPEKWAQYLEGAEEIHTRLSHNEVLRVSANQARNPYKVEQRPAGSDPKAIEKAKKQQRWEAEFFPAMERASALPLRRRFVDSQNGDSMGVYEVYLTHAYEDAVNFDQGEDEEDKSYNERTESEMLQLGECAEIGLRTLDPLSVYPELDAGGRRTGSKNPVCRVLIAERKAYRQVYASLVARKSDAQLEELRMPKPGDRGWPIDYSSWGLNGNSSPESGEGLFEGAQESTGDVDVLRYYDEVWYVEVVGGKITTCEPHGMPGNPVFVAFAIVTGTSLLSQSIQGITWGMLDIELAANRYLTKKIDTTMTYERPAPIAIADGDAQSPQGKNGQPPVIDLSDPTKVRLLPPGYDVKDAYEGFRSRVENSDVASLLGLWERNGLNPIAQGQSPGANAAGYTVNSLMGASLAPYDPVVENEEKVAGQVLDFVRLCIRDTVKEKCYLSAPMEDKKVGGTEWLGLGPEDIDETPVRVRVDPSSDANRAQIRDGLMVGNERGYITRSRVQREGFNVEDPEAEDIEIFGDLASTRLASTLVENVFQRVRIAPPAQPAPAPGGGGAEAQPMPGGENGAQPAPMQPPTVGAEASQASQGITSNQRSAARGGQNSGYAPAEGPLNRGAGV